jgi:hypothetical protein
MPNAFICAKSSSGNLNGRRCEACGHLAENHDTVFPENHGRCDICHSSVLVLSALWSAMVRAGHPPRPEVCPECSLRVCTSGCGLSVANGWPRSAEVSDDPESTEPDSWSGGDST